MKPAKCEIVIGCLSQQQDSLHDTLPVLMPAALYGDTVTIIARDHDTISELPEWIGEVDEWLGPDVVKLWGTDSYWPEIDPKLEYDAYWATIDRLHARAIGATDEKYAEIEAEIDREEIKQIIKIVESMLTNPEVIPLIHDPDNRLAIDAIDLGRLATATKTKQRADAKLGTGLINKLPSFEMLGGEEIAELRDRLSDLLLPFRSYVVETSEALIAAGDDNQTALDAIHEIYVGKVLPVLMELDKQMKDNGFIRRLLSDLGRDPKSFIQSFITLGVGEAAHLPLYVSVGGAIGNQVIVQAAQKKKVGEEIRKNRLFFLHEVERTANKLT